MRTTFSIFAVALLFSAGCQPDGGGTSSQASPLFYEDVAPILNVECVSCHSTGGIAPFSLETYEGAVLYAGMMKAATAARTMPPWAADDSGDCNTFKEDKFLTQSEIDVIGRWADGGAPMGDPANAPPPPPPPETLARVDTTLDMGGEYTPSTAVADDFRCFVMDTQITTPRFLTGYALHPGDLRVVHHVILYGLSSSGEAAAIAADTADPGLGYACGQGAAGGVGGGMGDGSGGMGGGGQQAQRWLAAWAPGDTIATYPAGTGLRLDPGRKVMMQIHYNLAQGAFPDRTTLDLMTEPSVADEAFILPLPAPVNLQPGLPYVETTQTYNLGVLPADFRVHGVGAHMHTRGRTLKVEVEKSGSKACMIDVPRFDFRWQGMYVFDQPQLLEKNSANKLHLTCGYDTSADTQVITWGEGTGDEMCIAISYITRTASQ